MKSVSLSKPVSIVLQGIAFLAVVLLALLTVQAETPDHILLTPEDGTYLRDANVDISVFHGFDETASCNLYLNDTLMEQYDAADTTHNTSIIVTTGSNILTSSCVFPSERIPSVISSIFTVDLIDPEVTLFPVLKNATINLSSYFLPIIVQAYEWVNLTIIVNDVILSTLANSSSNGSVLMPVTNGTNPFQYVATDRAGNQDDEEGVFTTVIHPMDLCENGQLDPGEEEIDCGPTCGSCIPYDILFDKDEYDLGDQVDITIVGRQESSHTLSLTGPDFSFSSDGQGVAGYFLYPENPGTYTVRSVFDYLGNIDIIEEYFWVINQSENLSNLQVAIIANPGTISPGESIAFSGQIHGGIQPFRLEWDFNDDYLIDSTEATPQKIFTSPGRQLIRLTAIDANGQEKSTERYITVKNRYVLNLTIRENVTLRNISGAEVDMNNELKESNSYGRLSFEVFSGTYLMTVNKGGYEEYALELTIENNLSKVIYLDRSFNDITPPIITVLEPYEGQAFQTGPIRVRYRIDDETLSECKHQQATYANLFTDIRGYEDTKNGTVHSFSIGTLEEGTNYFRIICQDLFGNSGEKSGSFTVKEGMISPSDSLTDTHPTDSESVIGDITFNLDDAQARMDAILDGYNKLDETSQRLIEGLGLREDLSQKKKTLKQTHRDLFNIQYRKMSDEEKVQERDILLTKLQDLQDSIVEEVVVRDSRSYVKYHTDTETAELTADFAESLETAPTERQKEQWIEANQDIAADLTVSTYHFLAELTYLDGSRKLITLVDKELVLEGNLTDKAIVEIIPKNLAESVQEITFVSEVEVIQDDPIVELGEGQERITYYFDEFKNLDDLEGAKTLLTYTSVPSGTGKGLFSGFAIFYGDGNSGSRIDMKTSVLASAILSLIVYLLFNAGVLSTRILKQPGRILKSKRIKHTMAKILLSRDGRRVKDDCKAAGEYLMEGRMEKAKDLLERCNEDLSHLKKNEQDALTPLIGRAEHDYAIAVIRRGIDQMKEQLRNGLVGPAKTTFIIMRGEFTSLSKGSRQLFKKDLDKLAHELNQAYLMDMVKRAHLHLDGQQHDEAFKIYSGIKTLFREGSAQLKEQTHSIAMELVSRLKRINQR